MSSRMRTTSKENGQSDLESARLCATATGRRPRQQEQCYTAHTKQWKVFDTRGVPVPIATACTGNREQRQSFHAPEQGRRLHWGPVVEVGGMTPLVCGCSFLSVHEHCCALRARRVARASAAAASVADERTEGEDDAEGSSTTGSSGRKREKRHQQAFVSGCKAVQVETARCRCHAQLRPGRGGFCLLRCASTCAVAVLRALACVTS